MERCGQLPHAPAWRGCRSSRLELEQIGGRGKDADGNFVQDAICNMASDACSGADDYCSVLSRTLLLENLRHWVKGEVEIRVLNPEVRLKSARTA